MIMKTIFSRKMFVLSLIMAFVTFITAAVPSVYAQMPVSAPVSSPAPSALMPSAVISGLDLRGVIVDPLNPLKMQFVLHAPNGEADPAMIQQASQQFADYFLASLAIPEKELWVNLSPYEPGRMMSEKLAQTQMGVDLLEEDYKLKMLVGRLMDPGTPTGRTFWQKAEAVQGNKLTQEDLKSLQKVWIVPQTAVIYENDQGAFIAQAHMGVMLEGEHLTANGGQDESQVSDAVLQALKDVIIPEVEREVQGGEMFVKLRQMYQAMILATWFKKTLTQSPLSSVYANQGKVQGVQGGGEAELQKIYKNYLAAFQRGAEGVMSQEYDPATSDFKVKVYQTGGANMGNLDNVLANQPRNGTLQNDLSEGRVYMADMSMIFLFAPDAGVRFLLVIVLVAAASLLISHFQTRKKGNKGSKGGGNNAMLARDIDSSVGLSSHLGDKIATPGGVDFNADLFKTFDVQKQGDGIRIADNPVLLKLKDALGGLRPVFVGAQTVDNVDALLSAQPATPATSVASN